MTRRHRPICDVGLLERGAFDAPLLQDRVIGTVGLHRGQGIGDQFRQGLVVRLEADAELCRADACRNLLQAVVLAHVIGNEAIGGDEAFDAVILKRTDGDGLGVESLDRNGGLAGCFAFRAGFLQHLQRARSLQHADRTAAKPLQSPSSW